MVRQYMEDLKDGCRMHPGVGVGTYIANAEALIELLEVHGCGSVGGFDPEVRGDSMRGLLYLQERSETLQHKYDSNLTPKKKSRGGMNKTPRQSLFGGNLVDAS
jgi:hypothetical protein